MVWRDVNEGYMEIMRGCLVIIDSFASDGICYGLVWGVSYADGINHNGEMSASD